MKTVYTPITITHLSEDLLDWVNESSLEKDCSRGEVVVALAQLGKNAIVEEQEERGRDFDRRLAAAQEKLNK